MEYVALYLLANVAIGLAACLLGKRLFYLVLGLVVFLVVFDAGLSSSEGSVVSLVVAVALGLVAALLSRYAYKAGVFLVGFVAGAALAFLVTLPMSAEVTAYAPVVTVVVGALCGLAAVRWSDLFVRLGTAYAGATLAVPPALAAVLEPGTLGALAVPGDALATFDALSAHVGGSFLEAHATSVLVLTLALTVVGAIAQGRRR